MLEASYYPTEYRPTNDRFNIPQEFINTLNVDILASDYETIKKCYDIYKGITSFKAEPLDLDIYESYESPTTNVGPVLAGNGGSYSAGFITTITTPPDMLPPKKIFAGIGDSDDVPDDVLFEIEKFSRMMAEKGWYLRSGASYGCDAAFEKGYVDFPDKKEIYLPWKLFNKHPSQLYNISEGAYELARKHHPAWNRVVKQGAQKLLARDGYQVLGYDLATPCDLVVCWTKDGKEVGGTAQAIRIARAYNIRVLNLATVKA